MHRSSAKGGSKQATQQKWCRIVLTVDIKDEGKTPDMLTPQEIKWTIKYSITVILYIGQERLKGGTKAYRNTAGS